jgi:hypothetical protein
MTVISVHEPEHEEEEVICRDCALDEAASTLVLDAHHVLRDEGLPADRQSVTDVLLRAASESNTGFPDESFKELDEIYDEAHNK